MGQEGFSSVLLIGVAGGSGSGKTTFSRMLQAHLNESFCGILSQDSYYRDLSHQPVGDSGQANFDHPESIEFALLCEHLNILKKGEDIYIPQYDFTTHRRREGTSKFSCKPVVIVDGILILSQPEVRDLLEFSFFIETPEDVRFQRRLYRDVRELARTPTGVTEQFLRQVKPMHDLFVEPSRQFAHREISGEKNFAPVIEEIVFGIRQPFKDLASLRIL